MSPLKVFEYMAAGKAIVCSDLPVLREVLEHERTALLVPPDDRDAWVGALVRLARDVPFRHCLGAAARRELEDKYTWQRRAQRVLEGIAEAGRSAEAR
jgi:glycosyltransferase involved in cell wall biosynthesis